MAERILSERTLRRHARAEALAVMDGRRTMMTDNFHCPSPDLSLESYISDVESHHSDQGNVSDCSSDDFSDDSLDYFELIEDRPDSDSDEDSGADLDESNNEVVS